VGQDDASHELRRLEYLVDRARTAEAELLDARREARIALVAAKQAGSSLADIARSVGVSPLRIKAILDQEEERRQQLLSDPDVTDTADERSAWREGRDPYTGTYPTQLHPVREPDQ